MHKCMFLIIIPHDVLGILFTGVYTFSVTQHNAAICHLHLHVQQNKLISDKLYLALFINFGSSKLIEVAYYSNIVGCFISIVEGWFP